MERGGSLRARYLQGENELRGGTGYLRCAARNLSSADATHHMGRESERERDTYFDDGVRRRGPPRSNGTRYKTFARVTLFHWHRKHE